MNYLAVLSLTASILYFYVGFHAIRSNRRSQLCRIFFYLTCSMAVWSFGQAFVYLAKDVYEYSFWNKIAAFGWCTFEALGLYFVLVLTSNQYIKYWYIKLLVMMPAFIFLYMTLFLFGPDINTKQTVSTFFYISDFIYNSSYLAVSILMIYLWGHRSKIGMQKKQAYIISICSIIPFVLNLFVQEILPALHIITLPNMGQLFSLIMLLGVYYAITKYQFMSIPSSLIANELFNELTGLTLLLDSRGCIMKANKQVYQLLHYNEDEIIGKYISDILQNDDIDEILTECDKIRERKRFTDIDIFTKSGMPISFHISIIPLFTSKKILGGVLVIGEDIRATKRLEEEIERHRITNKKLQNKSIRDGLTNLYNHQYINEVLEEKLSEASEGKDQICLMMLDVDHFKRVNDQYGHLAGDKVLQTVAELLLKNTRKEDSIGRYGGEEFIIVLSDIELKAAAEIAENIRCSIYYYDYGIENLRVSISIGVAGYEGEGLNAFINKADKLLYQAKANGRNKVECILEK